MGGLCLPNVSKTMVSEEPTMQNHVQNSALPVLLSLEVLRSFSKTLSKNLLKSPCLSPGLSLRLFPNLSPLSVSLLSSCLSPCPSPFSDSKSLPKSPKSLAAWMPRLGQFWFHCCDYFLGKSEVASCLCLSLENGRPVSPKRFKNNGFRGTDDAKPCPK